MTDPPDATVLIADDERELVDLYAAFLEPHYEVRTALNGPSALRQADETVDVVLLDRRMPDMSGDEVLEELRDRDLPCQVAMLTGVKPAETIVEMPFDDYRVKPVGRAELVSLVAVLMERATFDETTQEFFRLAAKKAALEYANNTHAEAYDRVVTEMERLRARIDGSLDDMADLPIPDGISI